MFRAKREGKGADARRPGPPPLSRLRSSAFCSRGDEDELLPLAGPKSCKQLGLLTHMCRLFCQEGTPVWGQGTGESPCGAGSVRGGHDSSRRVSALGPAPRLGNTERGSGMAMWQGGHRGAPLCWAPGHLSGQRAWALCSRAASAEQALPAHRQNPACR